jgi:hypothetical protein
MSCPPESLGERCINRRLGGPQSKSGCFLKQKISCPYQELKQDSCHPACNLVTMMKMLSIEKYISQSWQRPYHHELLYPEQTAPQLRDYVNQKLKEKY